MKRTPCFVALALVAGAASLFGAFAPGSAAYTKRVDTALLSEPKMLASSVAHLTYAKKLKVETVQGPWLKVNDGRQSGWVFGGNLTEDKPSEVRGLDGLPIAASETSAATAARPLTVVSTQYSERHGLATAASDLDWLLHESTVSADDVRGYLEAQKKGEYR
jgi:hypothetical protein